MLFRSLDIIVNLCTEDLSWLPFWMDAVEARSASVYTKCGQFPEFADDSDASAIGGKIRVAELPNTGREGSSWLSHILARTRPRGEEEEESILSLADWNVFLQGGSETSLNALVDTISRVMQAEKGDSAAAAAAKEDGEGNGSATTIDFVDFSRHPSASSPVARRCHSPDSLCSRGFFDMDELCNFHAIKPDFPTQTPSPKSRGFPIILNKSYIMVFGINS